MKKIHNDLIIGLAGGLLITFFLFWQFFIKGLYPIPANFMLAWYEPWKSNFSINNTITISHKPIAEDIFRQLYPFKVLAIDLIKNKEVPLWNPYGGSGMPLLATMHIGALSPFNVFFLFLSYPLAWSIQVIIQPVLIFLCTYFFCKKIKLTTPASFFSSTIYTLSGFVMVRIIYNEYIFALSALPLLLYLIEDYFITHSRKILFLPLVLLFLFLSNHPQPTMYVLFFSGAYFIYTLLHQPKKINSLILFSILSIVGMGLSAIQLIPTIELLQNSNINITSSAIIVEKFLLPLQHLVSIAIPNYYGNQATYNFWGFYDYIETIGYVGSIPILFSLYGLAEKINRKQLFFFFSTIVSLALTTKLPLVGLLYTLPIPLFSTGAPSRILMISTFCLSVLAGYGFNHWLANEKSLISRLKQSIPTVSVIMLIGIYTLYLYTTQASCNNSVITECRSIALRNTLLETSAFTVALLILVSSSHKFKKKIGHLMIISIVVVLGIYNGHKFLPFTQREYVMPSNILINKLKALSRDSRIFGLGEANLKTNFSTYYHLLDPNYYDPLYNKRYAQLVQYANNKNTKKLLRSDVEITNELTIQPESTMRRDKLFAILGIRYLFLTKKDAGLIQYRNRVIWENPTWSIVENKNVLPRAYIVENTEVHQGQNILNRLFDEAFNEKTTAIIEEAVTLKNHGKSTFVASAKIKKMQATNILLSTLTNSDGFLILTDNFYPGWKAFVDNVEVKIYRTNYTLRGIVVPAGSHTIRFSYEPLSFKLGVHVSGVFLLIYFLLLFWPKIRGQKNHR